MVISEVNNMKHSQYLYVPVPAKYETLLTKRLVINSNICVTVHHIANRAFKKILIVFQESNLSLM